jgi:hypothetical protein
MLTTTKDLKCVVDKLRQVDQDVATVDSNVDLFFTGEAKQSIAGNKKKSSRFLREYERALELQEMMGFDVVVKTNEKRTMKNGYSVPLVWELVLPTSLRSMTMTIAGGVEATAKVPIPPKEALDAIADHGALFDGLRMWWVPSDIKFKVPPAPDPIIVGELKGPEGPLFYELYRWIDATVEDPYYNAVAY